MRRKGVAAAALAVVLVGLVGLVLYRQQPARSTTARPMPQADGSAAVFVSYEEQAARWQAATAAGQPPRVLVKGIYLTGYTAGSSRFSDLVKLVDETELNAMVIDVKDDNGWVTYRSAVPEVKLAKADTGMVPDIDRRLATLWQHDIYPIARIVTFKDPRLAKFKPEQAVHTAAGGVWHDRTGAAWLDPYNRANWDYAIAIAREAALKGFREIQFDYVRFPSDGNTKDIVYPSYDGRIRADVIAAFLAYAHEQLAPFHVFVSADIFGLIPSVKDDQGIGQYWEKVVPAVDYVSPMAYPSHYAPYTFGLKDPDLAPYETVSNTIKDGLARMDGQPASKLRPWLQDFSMRHRYGAAEVRAQIKAASDQGVKEWILWNAANVYTRAALEDAAPPPRPEGSVQ
ncbi:MAG: putative glycoside hydrolase [Symbiobacteriia bacterium]